MNWQILNNQQFIENVGWTLIHSVWQISFVGLLLFFLLRILKNSQANLRYLCSLTTLFSVIVLPLGTFFSFQSSSTIKTETVSIKTVENSQNSLAKTIQQSDKIADIPKITANSEKSSEIASPEISDSFQNLTGNSIDKFLPYFVWTWFFGVLFFSFRFCGGIWKIRQIKMCKVSLVGEDWQKKFADLAEKIGIRRTVNFIQSEIIETPMVIGWLKPFVIVPASVLIGINPRELETIIAHELIHIRRRDYLVNILQSFVEIVLFFHPVMWWISAQIRRERENACDDAVLKIFDGEPLLYANALANLENFRFEKNNLMPSNIVAANGGNLKVRIQRILKKETGKKSSGASFWLVVPLLLIPAILTVVYSVNSQIEIEENKVKNSADSKKIAVGLYSSSTVFMSENSPQEDAEIMRRTVAKLKHHNIPATGFLKGIKVNPYKMENLDQEDIINLWRNAGFEIGLQDLKYPKSYNSKISQYNDALENQKISFSSYLKKQNQSFKELKNPDGKDSKEIMEKRLTLIQERVKELDKINEKWLKENNLTNVKYTLVTHDWIYSYNYDFANKRKDWETMNRIKAEYLNYMSNAFELYEIYARQIFERDIPQTLPLTPSRLLIDSADELFAIIEKRGYQFTTIDEAMQDEVYQKNFSWSDGTGSSWLDSAAMKTGKTLLDKPNVGAYILKLWEENQPKKHFVTAD